MPSSCACPHAGLRQTLSPRESKRQTALEHIFLLMAPPSCLFLSLRQMLPLVPRRGQEKRGLSSPSTPRRISLRKKGRVLLPPLASGVTLVEVDVVELGRVLKDDLAGDLLQNSDKVLLGGS